MAPRQFVDAGFNLALGLIAVGVVGSVLLMCADSQPSVRMPWRWCRAVW